MEACVLTLRTYLKLSSVHAQTPLLPYMNTAISTDSGRQTYKHLSDNTLQKRPSPVTGQAFSITF